MFKHRYILYTIVLQGFIGLRAISYRKNLEIVLDILRRASCQKTQPWEQTIALRYERQERRRRKLTEAFHLNVKTQFLVRTIALFTTKEEEGRKLEEKWRAANERRTSHSCIQEARNREEGQKIWRGYKKRREKRSEEHKRVQERKESRGEHKGRDQEREKRREWRGEEMRKEQKRTEESKREERKDRREKKGEKRQTEEKGAEVKRRAENGRRSMREEERTKKTICMCWMHCPVVQSIRDSHR